MLREVPMAILERKSNSSNLIGKFKRSNLFYDWQYTYHYSRDSSRCRDLAFRQKVKGMIPLDNVVIIIF